MTGCAEYPTCNLHGCPCGYATDTTHTCSCQPFQVQRYLQRISGPLLDRIDIHPPTGHPSAPPPARGTARPAAGGEPSAVMRERVLAARAVQQERFAKERGKLYAKISWEAVYPPAACRRWVQKESGGCSS